jgi:hypothetical protein
VRRPSGLVASQGDFARLCAQETRARLPDLACALDFADQAELAEPLVRVNDRPIDRSRWDEAAFWDDYVGYYQRLAAGGRLV